MNLKKVQIGISLIEILIALLILAAAFVTLLKFQGDLTRNIHGIKQQLQAITLAQDKMNELRRYIAIATVDGTPSYEEIVSGSSTTVQSGTSFSIIWTVTDLTSPDRKTVQLTVSWTDATNQSQSITLNGIIGKINPKTSGAVMEAL